MAENAPATTTIEVDSASPLAADLTIPEAIRGVISLDLPETRLTTLSVKERRLGLRVMPYGVVAEHPLYGALMFEPGAFGDVNPRSVRLRMDHENPPTGLGQTFTDKADAAYMEFLVSRTQRGDEQLQLAVDGVSNGVSPGFTEITEKVRMEKRGGRLVRVYGPGSAQLAEVSTTWAPTFRGAGVAYVLHAEEKGDGQMAEAQEAPAVGATITPGIDYERMADAVASALSSATSESKIDSLLSKFDQMVELQRSQYALPKGDPRKPKLSDWVAVTLKRMAGEQISPTQLKELALDDVVTTEQAGLVPNILKPDYDDVIDRNRPFLSSTREVSPPATGTSMVLPLLITRAVAGTQAGPAEKGALTTTAPKWGTGTFAYKAVFSGADISIQMIQRADSSFLDLLTAEFGEAYAYDCDSKALTALLAGYTDSGTNARAVVDGGVLDPESPSFGVAWETSISASKMAPDTIWLSSAGVRAFIDAKAPLTNAPLYSNLAAAFTAAGGPGGVVSGLRPIYVPALDAQAVDVIIGPARGFVWAEDPAIRLDVPVPSVAGRDIALVGGIFPAPRYCHAFTTYTVAS